MIWHLPFQWSRIAASGAFLMLAAVHGRGAVGPGEILIGEMNCVACHEAAEPIRVRLASRPSPRLDEQHAVRVNPRWLQAFLENPQTTQPGTLMPDLLAGLEPSARSEAAEALTHYLVELRHPRPSTAIKTNAETIQQGKALYHSVGCVACHAPEEMLPQKMGEPEGAADFAKLRQMSVPLGALEKKYTPEDLAAFLQDPLKSRPGGRMPSLKLTPAESSAIALYLLRAQAPRQSIGEATFAVDPTKASRGKELFTTLNCAACHQVDAPGKKAKPMAALNGRQPTGCLGSRPKAGVPKFEITDRQRVVILAQLGNQAVLGESLASEQQITRSMTTFNCYACHARDRRGGVDPLRRDYFAMLGEHDLDDKGRIPPSLRGVGAKLRSEWIKAVLTEGATVRPSMATRMPQYGADNVAHFPALFGQADIRTETLPPPDISTPGAAADANRSGRLLIGTGGLACISCHSLAGHKSLGMPGLDLATTGRRLNWDWFRRYLLDPESMLPGTTPPFWPGGVAVNKEILAGDTERQILAIWTYLTRQDFAELPPGTIRK